MKKALVSTTLWVRATVARTNKVVLTRAFLIFSVKKIWAHAFYGLIYSARRGVYMMIFLCIHIRTMYIYIYIYKYI
jgi:hypothetical protein